MDQDFLDKGEHLVYRPVRMNEPIAPVQEGHVTMVEESQQTKKASEANLYVVPYGRLVLFEPVTLHQAS